MKNFARALNVTLAHRWTFVASILCAFGVAVLWGGSVSHRDRATGRGLRR